MPMPSTLKLQRVAFGVKQKELAAAVSVSRQTIRAWERDGMNEEQAARYLAALVRITSGNVATPPTPPEEVGD